ncbi:O-acetylhomoserine aminocarboxypropyltransferase/cysteine synthase family protein [Candidatus Methanomethylophilus sp. 1R26]|uniref:O-acetylhomoserine aminocarboxypropyltransferase/cysteine synthase family protein n=1 Tax=Candidatus Methanomethylophilus sp. 1R26 TaxID=1769296 RepID=UPI0009E768A6|nr:aminotransferase class I/II-fold pyridoxal phosphate-dependent enzyme [Candidatus Methanomethylophilus sp. 1R26]WII09653.1 aminotransferase class I/II-fold pyridoxal phosphate-dependent enzyme [Methanomassiliicoccales archaeon LGM-DZ1]
MALFGKKDEKEIESKPFRVDDAHDVPAGPLNPQGYRFETIQIHKGQEKPAEDSSRAVPIYLTSSYVFKDSKQAYNRFALKEGGNIYGRLTNTTQSVFEDRIAALEGGAAALAVASGAAAVTYAVTALALSGDEILAADNLYGGTINLFTYTLKDNYGITTQYFDPTDLADLESKINDKTKVIYAETFGNPNSDVTDVDAIAEIAHKHKIAFVVDNTFATPYLFRPLEHGADIVVESATKFISGHGTVIAGVIIESGKTDWKAYGRYSNLTQPNPSYHGLVFADLGPGAFVTWIRAILLRDTGSTISPVTAFALLVSLESLSLRVDRQVENSLIIAKWLSQNPHVKYVSHPSLPNTPTHALYEKYFPNGAASIFTFEVNGTGEQAQKLTESLTLFSLLANVADEKSLIIHPSSTTHSELTEEELAKIHIYPTTVRISIGAENVKDLIADLDAGFKKVFGN